MIILVPFQQKTEISNIQKITTLELFKIILRIGDKSIQLRILSFLSISQLITILSAITKNEEDDEFYDFDKFSTQLKQLYLAVIESINSFPCVKFVDSLTSKTNDNNRTDDDDQFSDHSSYYELSITSQEYGFLLEYLMDVPDNKIKLKLIDIKTKHFTKIYDVVKFYSNGIKINNEELTVIGFSKQLLNKLKVLTLINYENFESFKQFNFEKLDVYGNEVDMNSIELLTRQAKRLKKVFLRGRLKELVPLNIPAHIDIVYDLLALNKININEIEHLGNNKIKSLYLNISENCDFELDWALINMKNLESLYISNNVPEKSFAINNSEFLKNLRLKKLTLQNCEISSNVDPSSVLISNLQILTLINCKINISTLNFLKNSHNLSEFYLVDCDVNWDNYIQLPQRLKKFSFYNANSGECKDLIIVTYEKYDSHESRDYGLRSLLLDLNSQLMEVKVQYNKQISILKLDHECDSNTELNSLRFPVDITSIEFTIYPNFSTSNFVSVDLSSSVHLKKVSINLCAYGDTYYKPKNLIKIDGVDYSLNYVNMCSINSKTSEGPLSNQYDSQKSSDDNFGNTTDSSFSSGSSLSEEDNNEDKDYESSGNGNFVSKKSEFKNSNINMNLNEDRKRSNSGSKLRGKSKARKTLPKKSDNSLKFEKGVVTNTNPIKQSGLIMSTNENKLSQSLENTKLPLKPYLCNICNKSFAKRKTYKTHSVTHTDFKPHTCGACGKGFRKSGHFRNHVSRCLTLSNAMPSNILPKSATPEYNTMGPREPILLRFHEKQKNDQETGQENIFNEQKSLSDADDSSKQSKPKEKSVIHII